MEDEKLDEDLEMLREMEGGQAHSGKAGQPKILVDDSQRPDMPLGPDGGGESEDSEVEKEGKGRDGKPLKVWKKKGQKRTTRRVLMRPNVAKWKPEPAWKGDMDSDGDGEQAMVEETQATKQVLDGDEDDYEDELQESEDHKSKSKKKIGEKKEGFVAKARRKISATAHANFRALKIKNKQTKGKRGSKFERRR
jgi:26S proteasome regulatory subunit N12